MSAAMHFSVDRAVFRLTLRATADTLFEMTPKEFREES
jgi:hypothetical protein